METVEFCHEFRDKGVVGIDITDEEKLPNGGKLHENFIKNCRF